MKQILTFSFLLLTVALYAQPGNDDCSGIIDLGVAPFCDDMMLFNNVGATQSDIGTDDNPFCWVDEPDRDVWFQFTAVDTILDYSIKVTGCPDPALGLSPISNPQIAIYRGDICAVDELVLLDCAPSMAMPGSSEVELLPPALTPGITYYLRINDWSSTGITNEGTFKLCIDKKEILVTIDEGGSTECSGQLTDSGGMDEDYGNNENHIFTICPDQPHACLNFTLDYYNIENTSDQILFFDGSDITGMPIGGLDGSGFALETNGGVCFQTFATSGCMTVQFISDGSNTFEGFSGFWECSAEPCDYPELISVDANITNQTIVDNIATDQTTVTIDTIICELGAIGTFTADESNIGLDKGLLITSGSAQNTVNPGTFFTSTSNNLPGDDDLDYLSTIDGNGTFSADACIIELDVFVKTDELTFEYVFGSEEYPEFVNTNFNDIFAFLVSGPGIMGDPNMNDQLNIATLPDGNNTLIQINSVNSSLNWEYYRNNENGASVAYDGLTSDYLGVKKSLTARTDVEPCNTYHLKIAVADRGGTDPQFLDRIYDSGVFMSEVKGGTHSIDVNYFSGIDYLVEECTLVPDEIIISIGEPKDEPTTYSLIIGGTATPGVDYEANFPTTITFPAGETETSFSIQALPDGITEGIETINIILANDFGCGIVNLAEITIELQDNLDVEIFSGLDTAYVCQDGSISMEVNGALNYFWSPPSVFDDPNDANPTATPTSSQWISVLGTLGVCQDVDSVWLEVTDPQIDIEVVNGDLDLCEGESVTLMVVNNVNNAALNWTPTDGIISDPNLPIIEVSPEPGSTTYTANVSLNGCGASASITVNVDDFDFPELTTTDTLICQNFSVTLAEPLPNSTTQFEWSPPFWIDDPTLSNATVTPDFSQVYTLVATSASGFCADTAEVNIDVFPAEIAISNPDTVEICIGESVLLESFTSTSGLGLRWTPDETLDANDQEMVTATPTETTKYYAFLEVGACLVVDSVVVVVDSLPDLSIVADPYKESYCEGEEITLITETYEPANFPNIDFTWEFGPGVQTPDSFLNLVLIALDTFTYIRETTNRGCSSIDSIEIIVIPTTGMEIIPSDTTICPGESVQFNVVNAADITGVMWEGNGLDCNDCFDPIATLSSSGNYSYSAEGEFEGCPVSASANIAVSIGPLFSFPTNTQICFGDAIDLNNPADPTSSFTWTLADGTIVSMDSNPSVSPTETTTYYVFATNGCERTDSITIQVIQEFGLELGPDIVICDDEIVSFNSILNPPFVSSLQYVWTINGEVQEAIGPNFSNVDLDENSIITVSASAEPVCPFSDSASMNVTVNPLIEIDSFQIIKNGEVADTIYEGEIFEAIVFTTPPFDLLTNPEYTWTYNGPLLRVTDVNMSGEIFSQEVDGDETIPIGVAINDADGCRTAVDFVNILVLDDPIQIPNAFTPDGDGMNDVFNIIFPSDLQPTLEDFKIFNRWGQLVYDNENGLAGWDGTQDGDPSAVDVYVYHVVYRISELSKKVTIQGEVTLLR
jgi:gliding motility-associated-like protein